jgi:antidote-toxin recognition MazE-like antitoxin
MVGPRLTGGPADPAGTGDGVSGFAVRSPAHYPARSESRGMSNGVHVAPLVSRAVQAARGSASLRVTIPQVVASTLGLRAGDELLWFLDPHSGAVRVEGPPKREE